VAASLDLVWSTRAAVAITSLNSLASDTTAGLLVASSVAVDNTTEKAVAYELTLTVTYPNSAPTVPSLYAYIAAHDGSVWEDDGYGNAVDGTDQTVTIGDPTAMRPLGVLPITQNRITVKRFELWAPPRKFCVIVHNGSGQTLGGSGHSLYAAAGHYEV
jgi:hypothetical protein